LWVAAEVAVEAQWLKVALVESAEVAAAEVAVKFSLEA
jgi:hypothetical protein